MTLTLTHATWQQHLHAWQQSQLSKKRLLQKTQPQTYHVLQMGKQTLRQNNTHLT
ncbi:MAG: hypothetical protein IPL02_04675 [Moraxellaceae bacterium]|nr:hypothetical protein [Moraxellaceae bacterium]MBK8326358.1 hypothetical protein [Moraxellaceae bacterium]